MFFCTAKVQKFPEIRKKTTNIILMVLLAKNKILLTTTMTTWTTFFMAALLPMATSLSPIYVVLVVQVVVKMKNTLVVITITLWNFIQLDSGVEKACKGQEIVVILQCRRKERIFKLWHDQTFLW